MSGSAISPKTPPRQHLTLAMIGLEKQPCDEGVVLAKRQTAECPERAQPWVLAATVLGSSMAFINGSVVNVALPAIQTALDASTQDIQWIVNGYALFLASLILVGGSAGDHFGQRRVFVGGILAFAAASVWCGLSADTEMLIVARAAQGAGGALLVPASLAILSRTFDKEKRSRAIGTWAGSAALTSAAGPLLGGWLIDTFSWRWVFFLAVPLAIAALAITLRYMPALPPPDRRTKLDVRGAFLATLGLGSLTYGLIESSRLGVAHPLTLGTLVGGLALLGLFLRVEARTAEPMMPLSVFQSRSFSGANLLTLLLYFALGAVLFFLPFNLMQVHDYTATQAGAAFLPFTLLVGGLSRWSGGLAQRFGARRPLIFGPLIAASGLALLALPGTDGTYLANFFVPMLVLGLGMGVSVAPLTTVVMSSVTESQAGIASGINNAASRVSWLLAVALMGSLALGIFGRDLNRRLASMELTDEVRTAVWMDRGKLAGLEIPASVQGAQRLELEASVDASFVATFRVVMLVAALLAVLSAASAAVMIESRPAS